MGQTETALRGTVTAAKWSGTQPRVNSLGRGPLLCGQTTPGGGGVRGQKKVCVPKIGLAFLAPLTNFIFLSQEKISDVDGRVGRPGLVTPPPPPGGGGH